MLFPVKYTIFNLFFNFLKYKLISENSNVVESIITCKYN